MEKEGAVNVGMKDNSEEKESVCSSPTEQEIGYQRGMQESQLLSKVVSKYNKEVEEKCE